MLQKTFLALVVGDKTAAAAAAPPTKNNTTTYNRPTGTACMSHLMRMYPFRQDQKPIQKHTHTLCAISVDALCECESVVIRHSFSWSPCALSAHSMLGMYEFHVPQRNIYYIFVAPAPNT